MIKQDSSQTIWFYVYNNLKVYFQGGDNTNDIGPLKTFFIGGWVGVASVFGNTLVDVVKTRMQVCFFLNQIVQIFPIGFNAFQNFVVKGWGKGESF